MYHSTPLPQNEIRTALPCGNLGLWVKYLVFEYLRLEWSGAICKVSDICSKKLQHFGKDSCWRQEKRDEEKNYLFHSVFRKAKCGSKNSVRLEENRSECYKGLDTVGIFVDTMHSNAESVRSCGNRYCSVSLENHCERSWCLIAAGCGRTRKGRLDSGRLAVQMGSLVIHIEECVICLCDLFCPWSRHWACFEPTSCSPHFLRGCIWAEIRFLLLLAGTRRQQIKSKR